MNRQQAVEQFQKKAEEIMEEMDGRFWDELFTRRSELAERLENSLKSLREKVEINGKECRYIYSSFLWTDLLAGRYRAALQAVGEDYILDEEPLDIWMDLEDFFQGLNAYWKKLMEVKIPYAGKVNDWDIYYLIAERAMYHFREIGFLLRFLLREKGKQKAIMEMIPEQFPRIFRWGEYRDQGETLFYYDSQGMDEERLGLLLKENFSFPYILQNRHFMNGKYKKLSIENRNLQYAVFENCSFTHVSFSGSSLWGGRFINCRLKDCSFHGAELAMARFENCIFQDNDWEEARFFNTFCSKEEPEELDKEQRAGILRQEEEYDGAIFFCGTGQAGERLHPSGRI